MVKDSTTRMATMSSYALKSTPRTHNVWHAGWVETQGERPWRNSIKRLKRKVRRQGKPRGAHAGTKKWRRERGSWAWAFPYLIGREEAEREKRRESVKCERRSVVEDLFKHTLYKGLVNSYLFKIVALPFLQCGCRLWASWTKCLVVVASLRMAPF